MDDCMGKGMLAVTAAILLLLEFWKWYSKAPPSPLGAAIVCVPVFAYAVYKMVGLQRQIKNLKQGLHGEKIVGQQLEHLRIHGYRVFHDLIGSGFNIDHILVGPAGVFSIETKTWSRNKGDKIRTDGKSVWQNQIEANPNPINQAKAQAGWPYRLIKEITDLNAFVQPVILFPGWWVEEKIIESQPLVLNPDRLEVYLKQFPKRLEQKDIGLISNRLELLARENKS